MRHAAFCIALLTACGSSDTKDATPDPTTEDSAAPFLGTDPAVTAASGEALAGVVRDGDAGEDALTGGITAEAQSGDLVLWNSQARFVIQGARPGHGIVHTAGNVLDADIIRTDGSLGRDTVEDVFLAFGLSRLFHADSVEVLSEGGPNTAAVVQARGTDVVWEYWEGMFERTSPLVPDLHLDIITTYTLEPDSPVLHITTELTNPGDDTLTISLADGIFASGEELQPWAPGTGFEGVSTGPLEAAWYVGRHGEGTFGLFSTTDTMSVGALAELAAQLGIFFAEHPAIELGPGQTHTLRRQLAVAPDIATGEAARHQLLGTSLGTVDGTTLAADGTPVPGVRVHFVDSTGAVGAVARSAADGTLTAQLPPGDWTAWPVAAAGTDQLALPDGAGRLGPYTAGPVRQRVLDVLDGTTTATATPHATGRGELAAVPVPVTAGSSTPLAVEVPAASTLRVHIQDAAGNPLPGLLDLRWSDGRPAYTIDAALTDALDLDTGSRQAWGWTATGTIDLAVPPGTFDLHVGHSWRHSQATEADVVVSEGETVELTVTLNEVVPRDGWLAMDSHLHAAPSFDGALPMEDRLIGCATSGVDLPVATDHDAMTDYRPLATALGLDHRLQVIPGLEVTSLMRGHFNVFPLEPAPLTEVNGGAVRWWDIPEDTQELMDRMHAAGTDAIVQVNHPRSPGMFAFAGYDPNTGIAGDTNQWSWDFELMELLNGGTSDFAELREDWFSMLDLGYTRVPTGVSDSHYRFIPCGLARTDVFLDTDTPADVTHTQLLDALQAGHVVVSSGTTLRATWGDALPGDTVTSPDESLHITVQAPAWVHPGTLYVLVDGIPVHEQRLEDDDGDGTWFDDSLTIDVPDDAWVVVEVRGDTSLGDAWRNALPYAITNAFFVDPDADGWSAPGLSAMVARQRQLPAHTPDVIGGSHAAHGGH